MNKIFLILLMLGTRFPFSSFASEDEGEPLRPPSPIAFAEQEEAWDDNASHQVIPHAIGEGASSFEQHLQDPARLKATLEAAGIDPTEDNIASRFWEEKDLYERLVNNHHGTVLNLTQTSFTQVKSLLIFDALRETKSVQYLDLSRCQLPLPYYLALGTALSLNTSLQVLNLRQATWPNHDLSVLALILQNSHSLQEIILPTNLTFQESQLQSFYQGIQSNRHLRLICWPASAFNTLKDIAQTNPVAMVHLGVSYLVKLIEPDPEPLPLRLFRSITAEQAAMALLTQADQHRHPIASYELGRIEEKEKRYEEALKWYKRSAELGYAAAQYKLAEYYRAVWPQHRSSLAKAKYEQALEWFDKSARQGYAPALYRLGRLYEVGRGSPISLSKAGEYFYEALIRGYPEAFVALGALCRNPSYEHANEVLSKYYLEWGKKFPQVSFQAERLLKFSIQE